MTPEEVFIAEPVADNMRAWAEASRPLETGGVLVGVLRDGAPWVTSAVLVKYARRSGTSFEIPRGATPVAVEMAQQHDPRVGFLGFWHSHPANAPASPTDKATLRRAGRRRSRPKDVPAVMVVVRDSGSEWCLDVLRDRGAGPAPAAVTYTGPLSPEDADDAR